MMPGRRRPARHPGKQPRPDVASKTTGCRTSHRSTGPRRCRHDAEHEPKGGVSEPHRGSQLVARLDYFQDQQKGPITRAEFLAKALRLSNEKTRELGWIV